jgi:hypothetical protein
MTVKSNQVGCVLSLRNTAMNQITNHHEAVEQLTRSYVLFQVSN